MRVAIRIHGDEAAIAASDEFGDGRDARLPIWRQAVALQERRDRTVRIEQVTVLIGAKQVTPSQRAEQRERFLRGKQSAAQHGHLTFEHEVQMTHGGGVPRDFQQVVAVKRSVRPAVKIERMIHRVQGD